MSSTRLSPILFVSVTLTSLAIILQGSNKAEAKAGVAQIVQNQSAVPASQANLPTSPAPSGMTNGIPPEQAQQHIGETNTVCGLVARARYLDTSKTKPTLLNLGRPYPDHAFSVMIPDSDRSKFKDPPEVFFNGKTVCVTGMIIDFRGKPQIMVEDPSQIVVTAAAPAAPDKPATNTVQKTPTANTR